MTKTRKELEQQNAELLELLRLATTPKPSKVQQFWTWCKPYLVPFILGAMLGGVVAYSAAVSGLPSVVSQTSLEKQAALGGAAIPPFPQWTQPKGNPSPSLLALPPSDSNMGTADSSLTSTSEPPLPNSPQADNGQTPSTRFYRPLIRRIR